ncbi:MAG: agmatine deiminase family protein [Thaumarchaeota archaeon]|nr:agmatine deiminase family protein [Nitrososphaerota archaeon]
MKSSIQEEALPKALGYRMPAEWEFHSGTWITWPHNIETWPNRLPEVEDTFAKMVDALSGNEQVNILVNSIEMKNHVLEKVKPVSENVFTHIIETCDSWIRDYGPTFIVNEKRLALIDWRFNAWGGKYDPWPHDDDVPSKIATILDIPIFSPDMILEGGSIEVNGAGSCLTTESCLLNPNRNPSLSRAQIEERLKNYLGLNKIIWLKGGIAGDDTDGHIDDIARFVNASTVICCLEEDQSDENYSVLTENYTRLLNALDQDGKKISIIPLPMPEKIDSEKRLPASYANFYIGNNVVLVPTFDDPNDKRALRVLQASFPKRAVIGIDSKALVEGFGAFHCLTLQQPNPQ